NFTDTDGSDNTLNFTPSQTLADGESETVTVTVDVTDDGGTDNGGNNTGDDQNFTIIINGENDAPTTTGLDNRTNDDGEAISDIDTSTEFSDVDATDTLEYSAAGLPTGLTINSSTGEINGTIDDSASQNGTYNVTVTATDFDDSGNETGTSVDASFNWTVNNRAPTATNNTGAVTEDDLTITTGNVIDDSDSDPEDPVSQLVVSEVNGSDGDVNSTVTGNYGNVTIEADGNYTYNLNNTFTTIQELAAGETLTDTFEYTLSDQEGGTDTATLTVTITGTNDQPVLDTALSNQTDDDGDNTVSVDISDNFSDIDASDTLTYNASNLPTGLAINSSTGVISGTINDSASQSGPYSVTITADDGSGKANAKQTDTFDWTVNNPAPNATDNNASVTEDGPTSASGNVITDDDDGNGGDSDPDDPLSQLVVSEVNGSDGDVNSTVTGNYGNVTIEADGNYTYNLNDTSTPVQQLAAGETLNDIFNYTVSDQEGGTDTATLTVTITGDTTAPEVSIDQPTEGETFATDTVAFNASANETGDWTYSVDGAANQTASGGANGTQTLNTTLNLSDGQHNITVYADDGSGNIGSDTVNFSVDTTSPSISNVSVSNPEGQNVSVSFDSSEELDNISVDIAGAENATLNESDFTYDTDNGTYTATYEGSSDGTYNATVETAEDDAGNDGATQQSEEVTVDTTAPEVTIDEPADGSTLNASDVPAALNASTTESANWTYSINGAANQTVDDTDANGTTTLNETLTDSEINGADNITVYAEDDSGNVGFETINITGDTTAPSISNVSVSNPEGQNVSVSFNSSEQLDNISVNVSGAEDATLTEEDFTYDTDNGTYTATYEGSSDGTYNATVETAEDGAGNGGATGQSDEVTVDTTAPDIPNDSFTVTNPAGQNVSVTFNSSEELSNISVDLSGPENTTLTEDDFTYDVTNGTYTATYKGSSDGTYNATLETAEDSAGNDGA
ncbi:MAG: putative Ig domain-containing protein, partial [Haloarculaceae archaeon]